MALDPIFLGHEDLYEPSKIYLFGKPFKGLEYVRNDLAKSDYRTPTVNERLPLPPGLTEETLIRNRFGPKSNPQAPPPITVKDTEKDEIVEFEPKGQPFFRETSGKDDKGNPVYKYYQLTSDYEIRHVNQAESIATDPNEPKLARIYSFSYGGHYYKLPCPHIYMVWGDGKNPIEKDEAGLPRFNTVDTGLEGKNWRFGSDIRVWKMDRQDQSMVIDLEIGDLEDILLEPVFTLYEASGNMDSRMSAASRMSMNSRMSAASRMSMNSRMSAASRMSMAGPHQD